MKRILFSVLFAASLSAEAQTQTFETAFARPLNEVLTDIQNRFGIRLKYDIDTVLCGFSYPSLFSGRIADECIVPFRL